MAQMLTIAHGHQDQNKRRARVQNVNTPFGARERVSAVDTAIRVSDGERTVRGDDFWAGVLVEWQVAL